MLSRKRKKACLSKVDSCVRRFNRRRGVGKLGSPSQSLTTFWADLTQWNDQLDVKSVTILLQTYQYTTLLTNRNSYTIGFRLCKLLVSPRLLEHQRTRTSFWNSCVIVFAIKIRDIQTKLRCSQQSLLLGGAWSEDPKKQYWDFTQ